MKTFSQFLREKFVRATKPYKTMFGPRTPYEIFTNPTPGEMKEILADRAMSREKGARFILDSNKNRAWFMKPYEEGATFIHVDMIDLLAREGAFNILHFSPNEWGHKDFVEETGIAGFVYMGQNDVRTAESYHFKLETAENWEQIANSVYKIFRTLPERSPY